MWGFAPQAFEELGMVVGQQKGVQVVVELGRGLVGIALHGGLFERAVEVLDLPIGSGMGGRSEAVFVAVLVAHAVEDRPPGRHLVGPVAKWRPLVSQYFMSLIRDSGQDPAQKICCQHLRRAGRHLGKGEFAGAINSHKQVDAAFFARHLGEVYGQIAKGVVLELLFFRARPGPGQAATTVTQEETVQSRARELREGVL
jgi:hypothetical protein